MTNLALLDAVLARSTGKGSRIHSQPSEGSVMEAVDTELDRLISRRASQDRRQDPDESEEAWKESVRAYNNARSKERRAQWYRHHMDQAERLRRSMTALAEHHERQAIKLLEGNQQ